MAPSDAATIRALSATIERLTAMLERTLGREAAPSPVENTRPQLTARELDVARLICEGCTSEQIGKRLTVEHSTVRAHRRSISRKVGTSSRAGLIAKREMWDTVG